MIKCTRESFASFHNWVLNLPPIKRFFQPPSSSEKSFYPREEKSPFHSGLCFIKHRAAIFTPSIYVHSIEIFNLADLNRNYIDHKIRLQDRKSEIFEQISFLCASFRSRFRSSMRCKRNFFNLQQVVSFIHEMKIIKEIKKYLCLVKNWSTHIVV